MIECKYNKKELLLISALVSENGTRRQAQFLTAIFWLAGIANDKERLHREERLPWQVQTMVHPQRDTQADRQLLVGNLPPPIQVHTSQAFLRHSASRDEL